MKRVIGVFLFCAAVWAAFGGAVFEHCVYDAVSLNGEWEMAYKPYAHENVVLPEFKGVRIADAIPGYWEDMVEAFRAAGMEGEFRLNAPLASGGRDANRARNPNDPSSDVRAGALAQP